MRAEETRNSWGWLSHLIGGEYRRVPVTDGADHASLFEARNQFIEESAAEDVGLTAPVWCRTNTEGGLVQRRARRVE